MSIRTFLLPDPGEGLVEADIVTWRVAVGDEVAVNDVVVEIETSKSLVELPIPWAGTIVELLVPEGTTIEVGTPIIRVDDHIGADPDVEPPAVEPPAVEPAAVEPPPVEAPAAPAAPAAEATRATAGGPAAERTDGRQPNLIGYGAVEGATTRRPRRTSAAQDRAGQPPAGGPALATPPVRHLARELGVDLDTIAGTGIGVLGESGVVTAEDVRSAYDGSGAAAGGGDAPRVTGGAALARETTIPVRGVRKITAEAMVASAFSAPHVTEWVEVDVTATRELMDRLVADRAWREVRVTELLFVARAVLLALGRHPGVNAVWRDTGDPEIVQRSYVNLGVAAATPRGLLVPNIKDADALGLRDLADALTALVATARAGRTQPADMARGTFTITNVGVFGVDGGTPIINPGESAILCVGAVRRKPWVVVTADGSEAVEPRWVTTLALSFDHRLIDGDLGSRFLADVALLLSDPAMALTFP